MYTRRPFLGAREVVDFPEGLLRLLVCLVLCYWALGFRVRITPLAQLEKWAAP